MPNDSLKTRGSTDYTGLKIGVCLAPVLLFFIYLGKADMGLTVFIVLAAIVFAAKLRWKLKKHFWFWGTIICIFVLNVPLFLVLRWPQGKGPTLFYTMPIGIAEFLLVIGALGLAGKIFSKESLSDHKKNDAQNPTV